MTMSPRTLALLAALSLSLGACAHDGAPAPELAARPDTALDVWPERVRIESTPEEIRLAQHDTGLSGPQARALSDLYGRWTAAGAPGEIVIQAPAQAPSRVQVEAQAFLVGEGAPAHLVRLAGYDAAGPAEPVIVGFLRHQVAAPDCGGYWGGLTMTRENEPYYSFGCATASNLAIQVANPADLVNPRAMDPASAQRRDTVMGKYRAGEATSAAAEPNGAGAISTAVQ